MKIVLKIGSGTRLREPSLDINFVLIIAGVYPDGAPSHGYVDFAYVGGTQNPLKDPVPRGSLNFTATLPNGVYHYKYM